MQHPQYPGYVVPQVQPDGSQLYVPGPPAMQQPAPQQYGPPPQGYPPPPPPVQQPPPPVQQPPPQGFYPPTQGYPQGYPPPPQPSPQYGQPPPMPAMMQQPPPQYGGLPVAPTNYIPSQAEFQALYQRSQADAARIAQGRAGGGGFGKIKDMKFLGPNGEKTWAAVPIGFERSVLFRLLGAAVPGQPFFHEGPKHFWKSQAHPAGMGGWCPSSESCRLCIAIRVALSSGSDDLVKRARMAKPKTNRLYQGFQLGTFFDYQSAALLQRPDLVGQLDPRGLVELHRNEVGRVRPLLYNAPSEVHFAVMNLANERQIHIFLDLRRGAPFKLTRKKTGPESVNIGYTVIDMLQLAGPLPPEFGFGPNGEGIELLDLAQIAKPFSTEDQEKACQELGFAQTATAYSYAPAPGPAPYGSPFAPPMQQPQQQPQAQAWQPGGALPAMAPQVGGAWQPPAQQAQPWPQQPAVLPTPAQAWTPPPPPVLPTTGQPAPTSYAAPRPDPWSEQGAQAQRPGEPPAGWQAPAQAWTPPLPPLPPATAGGWGPSTPVPGPELAELQAQMTGQTATAPAQPTSMVYQGTMSEGGTMHPQNGSSQAPGPAFPPPAGAGAPPVR